MEGHCIAEVIQELVQAKIDDEEALSAEEINAGLCHVFMTELMYEFPDAQECHQEVGVHNHYFIKFQGRFYDAETPLGVEDWHELPWYVRAKQETDGE